LFDFAIDQEDGVDITANSLHPGATFTNIYLQSPLLTGNPHIHLCKFLGLHENNVNNII